MRWRQAYDLPTSFARLIPPPATEIGLAVVMTAFAIGGRLLIGLFFPNVVIFALVFPAVVIATLLAGPRSGAIVIVCCQMLAWYLLVPPRLSFHVAGLDGEISLVLSTSAECLLLWLVAGYRKSMRAAAELEAGRASDLKTLLLAAQEKLRLDERMIEQEDLLRVTKQNLEAIFSASDAGLTLCRAIRDGDGRLVDYQVLEVNDAHRRLTGATREQMLSMTVSKIAPLMDHRWLNSADHALKSGAMQAFDVHSPLTGCWLNIRVSPVSDDLFQQTFVDVTDRHLLDAQRHDLMQEMSHRVMNNFQMIANFLHIQSLSAAPSAKAQLEAAERRVYVLAKLHLILAYTEHKQEVDAAAYIAELCDQLRQIIDRPEAVKLDCNIAALSLSPDKVVLLGLILTELVTNAAKYAFPPPRQGVILVGLSQAGKEWLLVVQDNGKGLSDAASKKDKHKISGLGTRLVNSFIEHLGARLITTELPGLRHEIFFRP